MTPRPLRIERVELLRLAMPLLAPFTTSFGTTSTREFLLVHLETDQSEGWAEVVAMEAPLYNEETVATARHVLRDFLIPEVLGRSFDHPRAVAGAFRPIRRNFMARAGLEMAFWDAWSRAQGLSLAAALNAEAAGQEGRDGETRIGRERIPVGVSIGIQDDIPGLLHAVERFLGQGYRRIKIKIEPGWDVEVVRQVRQAFGDIPLMVDANSAYTLDDVDVLRALDEFGLMMIEQPLGHDDIVDHARLQAAIRTPICLDESIHTVDDARRALDLGSCRIINVKVGRMGGLSAALDLHALCRARGVPLWCGGMLESGIGRLHNVHMTSLPGFTLPGDTSGSDRYWAEDIVEPPVRLNADGTITVPQGPGIGHEVRRDRIERFLLERESFDG